jgi:plasmid maintenance system antidote protein VapI
LRMQQAYDLWYTEQKFADVLSKIETSATTSCNV